MPKRNNKVYCINHPDEEMYEHDNDVLINTAKQGHDKRLYHGATAHTCRMFYCGICDYVELYITSAEDVLQQGNDQTPVAICD